MLGKDKSKKLEVVGFDRAKKCEKTPSLLVSFASDVPQLDE
jgi:hypothetical protein